MYYVLTVAIIWVAIDIVALCTRVRKMKKAEDFFKTFEIPIRFCCYKCQEVNNVHKGIKVGERTAVICKCGTRNMIKLPKYKSA